MFDSHISHDQARKFPSATLQSIHISFVSYASHNHHHHHHHLFKPASSLTSATTRLHISFNHSPLFTPDSWLLSKPRVTDISRGNPTTIFLRISQQVASYFWLHEFVIISVQPKERLDSMYCMYVLYVSICTVHFGFQSGKMVATGFW